MAGWGKEKHEGCIRGATATRLKRILQQQRSQNKQNRCAFSRPKAGQELEMELWCWCWCCCGVIAVVGLHRIGGRLSVGEGLWKKRQQQHHHHHLVDQAQSVANESQ